MKATLEFDLPAEEAQMEQALHAGRMQSIIWDITQKVRHKLKYEDLGPQESQIWEEVRTMVWEVIEEHELGDFF